MKRQILIIIGLMMCVSATAQFTISSSAGHSLLTGAQYNIDAIAVFNTIPSDAVINYTGGGNFVWSYVYMGETYTSTQQSITPDDGTLYTISINGTPTYHIYVVDYSKYAYTCDYIETDPDRTNVCTVATIMVHGNFPEIPYRDRNGKAAALPRTFFIGYTTSAWDGTAWGDSAVEVAVTLAGASTLITQTVPAPLKDCTIQFYGDSLAEMMQLTVDTCSVDYMAVAVEPKPTGVVIERDAKNEKDRSSQTAIQGSAPLVVQLNANVNPISNVYIEWFVSNVTDTNAYLRFTDATVNYTFEQTGEYQAKVMVKSPDCSYIETLNIKTLDSYIEVPNVFTPNADGINDEFRVAYKSLREFTIWIYNRWGRLVYKSTDPGKGWDGTINGRKASVGTYYYIINAYGEDKDDDGKWIHYKLKGDCNLLR